MSLDLSAMLACFIYDLSRVCIKGEKQYVCSVTDYSLVIFVMQ